MESERIISPLYQLLYNQTVKEVDITNSYTIPSNYFENTSVLKIEDIKVEGKVYMNASEDDEEELTDYIEASIKGDITTFLIIYFFLL